MKWPRKEIQEIIENYFIENQKKEASSGISIEKPKVLCWRKTRMESR